MRADYTEVFRDPKAAEKYADETYASGSFSSKVSDRQRQWLRGYVAEAFDAPPVHHDFACGTGRIIRMLHGVVRQSHGYDTSEAMLAKARELDTPGKMHVVRASGQLPNATEHPALVTMFRLLLNASEEVRERAMEFAAGMLPDRDAGLLVCENHGNSRSIRHLRALVNRSDTQAWFAELSHRDVLDLLDRHGFELVARQGFTMLTRGFYHRSLLSKLAPGIDDVVARRPSLAGISSDVVYVARRR